MTPEKNLTLDQPARYRIIIQGRLPENWNDYFAELVPTFQTAADGSPVTLLSGDVSDQSSLHGILRRMGDLGLPLLEVKMISNQPPKEKTP